MTRLKTGAHRAQHDPDRPDRRRPAVVAWWDRLMRGSIRTLLFTCAAFAAVTVGVIALLAVAAGGGDDPAPAAAAAASAAPVPARPNEQGDPQPGPTPESGAVAQAQQQTRFGINAQALLDEMRKHDPALTDADAAKLVAIGDRAIARNQPDLSADDAQITEEVRAAFPGAPEETVTVMVRCTAEYSERQWALLHNTAPPDSNDHQGN